MSEEEIIDEINYMINNWHRSVLEIRVEWIQGILDLYNKEKEKNKELENKLNSFKHLGMVEMIDKYFIDKDKIREKVEYIRFMVDDDNKPSEIVKEVNLYLDLFLQELLEERN